MSIVYYAIVRYYIIIVITTAALWYKCITPLGSRGILFPRECVSGKNTSRPGRLFIYFIPAASLQFITLHFILSSSLLYRSWATCRASCRGFWWTSWTRDVVIISRIIVSTSRGPSARHHAAQGEFRAVGLDSYVMQYNAILFCMDV